MKYSVQKLKKVLPTLALYVLSTWCIIFSITFTVAVIAQPVLSPISTTLQDAATTGNGSIFNTTGYTLIGVQIVENASGDRVVNFEVSQDGTNYVARSCVNVATASAATTTATNSLYVCGVAGTTKFKARVSGGTTGTVTVTATALDNAAANGQGTVGGSGGGSGTVTSVDCGTGLTCTPDPIIGSGTIALSAGAGGLTWTEVTGTTQALVSVNGYIMNNAALVTGTLPTTCALGETIEIVGKGAGLWRIAQNAGQIIHFGNASTTSGTGGSITATHRYDAISLRCIIANTTFAVLGAQGSMTIL